jgi:hypothetical protein
VPVQPEPQPGLLGQFGRRFRHNSEQPSQDALDSYDEKADRLRLMDAMPVKQISERDRRYVLRVLQTLLVVVVVGQRILLPIGAFPVSVALVAAFIAIGLARLRGGLQYNRVRSELYIASGAIIVGCAWFTSWRGDSISVPSLLLLLVIYLPWVFCVSTQFLDLMLPLLRSFVTLMVGIALVGAGQMVAQVALGWQYTDFLALWLPENWLDQGYNTTNQISYTNATVKANGFVFLEPSFLCQFCALALIVSLLIRAPAWKPLVLGIGMAATLSGTGILLLALGIALLFVLVPNRIRPSYLLAGIIGLAIVFSTPAADILLDRRDETSQQGSSGSLRFVQPYSEVSNGLAEDPTRYVVGAGPGASDRLLESSAKDGVGQAVVYGIAPKMAFEYGFVAAVVFVAFLLVSILRGPPLPVLPTSVVFMIFFLSGSLLHPPTVMLAWLMTSIWGRPVTLGVSDALAAALRRQRQTPITVISGNNRQDVTS